MIPVAATADLQRERAESTDVEDELLMQLSSLGVDPLRVTVTDSTLDAVGLLHLDHIPIDERKNRVETVIRAVLQNAGYESTADVDVQFGWDHLPSTSMLPPALQDALVLAVAEVQSVTDDAGPVTPAEVSDRLDTVYGGRPRAVVDHGISKPMFAKLVREYVREEQEGASPQIGDS